MESFWEDVGVNPLTPGKSDLAFKYYPIKFPIKLLTCSQQAKTISLYTMIFTQQKETDTITGKKIAVLSYETLLRSFYRSF